ncbi:MAG: RagB/SusD family nutrient uptake outer membrane protein [Prevotella sp.]|nr:RagB/SusD family nutrient uptake outer membrane protein [Prevotella sp.]
MKRYFSFIILPLSFSIALSSCGDFLEPENKAAIEAEGYFATADGQEALRVVMYSSMKGIVTNTALTENGTDLYVPSRGLSAGNMGDYSLTAENSDVTSFYQTVYAMINNANCMLKYGAANPRYCAEARFIRAYGYYMLTQQFGPVPYITEYIESARKDYPRTPLADIYQGIISDLESIAADENLPQSDHQGNVSRRAAKALLAKVCLAAGWDLETTLINAEQGTYNVNATNYFSKALQAAEDAIGGQALTMSFEDKWAPANEGNDEEVFSVQYERNGFPGDVITGGHSLQGTYGSQMGNPVENGMKACGSSLSPSAKSIYLWAEGDSRLSATFMMTTYNYVSEWLKQGYFAYYHNTPAQLATMSIADIYFPWYTPTADIEKFISSHQSQLAKGSGALTVQVHHLASQATLYSIKQNGQKDKTFTESYSDYLRGQHGSAVVPTVKKYDDPETPQQNNATGYRDIVVLHLSDIYLVGAEAALMAGNEAKALQLLNAVRQRANATAITAFSDYQPDYESDVNFQLMPIDLILDERARELYGEQGRWLDLRRTRQLVRYNVAFNPAVATASDMANAEGQLKWLRPIPAAEIETNTAISQDDQNAGY